MAFYHPRAIDPRGGFYHFYRDDGTVYDAHTRHLVSSTRFVFNYAMAYRQFGDPAYLEAVRHGLAFLRERHLQPATGGYAWLLDGPRVADATNHCYGLAFVLLAYAHAAMAGVDEARPWIGETFDLMERRFWSPPAQLYADEASADWSVLSPYRGQNANMHSCEALLAAFEATGEARYLARAATLAHNITVRQAALAHGLVWEHYHADWSVDWDYNKDDKTNIFRPWGYQPGHLTEWAKLLLILERHRASLEPRVGLARRARRRAVRRRARQGLGRGARRHRLRLRARRQRLRRRQVLLGAGRVARGGCPARPPDRQAGVLAVVRQDLGVQLGALRGPPVRRLVPDPHARQQKVQRREEPRREDRLPHHGRLLRGAQRLGRGRSGASKPGWDCLTFQPPEADATPALSPPGHT